MDALVILLVQLTVRIVIALTQFAMLAAVLIGQGLGWTIVTAWRRWQRRRLQRRWR